ncbi:MAG: hypothetical protein OH319_00280 [Candidatus Parvarchaeota archaeon]|nr:hypothetical protein [Candidatus Jingweiarchaeum tengchongense]MCW1298419.1 hypothetical protein [Candidatus Jingweiarchaeum tengchongense]MCW1310829.1 hypothetical protein [Candidatus Jingweiarchaeum tengchongense]
MKLTKRQKYWIRALPYLILLFILFYYLITSTYYLYAYIFYYPCTSNILQSCDVYKKILERSNTCRIRVDWQNGIMTDICNCNDSAWFRLPVRFSVPGSLEFVICSSSAGDDGVMAVVSINETRNEFFIPPNQCVTKKLELSKGYFIIEMKSNKFGVCKQEWVFWKSLRIIKS